MKLLMLVTADYASIEPQTGKLNILGLFRSIFAANFPAKHRVMAVVVKLGGELGDNQEQHELKIALADEDGNEIFHVSGAFGLPDAPPGIQPEHNLVLELRDIGFPHPGTYGIYVTVDNDLLGSTSVVLAQLQSPQQE
jgi:hypothetical protein